MQNAFIRSPRNSLLAVTAPCSSSSHTTFPRTFPGVGSSLRSPHAYTTTTAETTTTTPTRSQRQHEQQPGTAAAPEAAPLNMFTTTTTSSTMSSSNSNSTDGCSPSAAGVPVPHSNTSVSSSSSVMPTRQQQPADAFIASGGRDAFTLTTPLVPETPRRGNTPPSNPFCDGKPLMVG